MESETKDLTLNSASDKPLMRIDFNLLDDNDDNITVMTIDEKGGLLPGPGLSEDEATRRMFEVLRIIWEEYLSDEQ